MCGVNGIFGIEDTQKLRQGIEYMNQSLSHRGPNDEGEYYDNSLVLGHRRLSILDLSKAGHQPMKSFNGRYIIVFNGEIYNYKELKSELNDYPYHSSTDTEVILAAYMKWGKDCVNQLNGMFAFAIWDVKKRELFITRDRLGIKPLYYHEDESIFVFSSEIRAILNSGLVPKRVNKKALTDYLRYQTVHAPNTIVKDVKMLPPGCCMTVSEKEKAINKYWDINSYKNSQKPPGDYKQVKARTRELLTKSIDKRLVSDVPIGAFLSGGIDSSAIVGLMSELSPGNVSTFSVTFEESEFSEAPYSRKIARKFNTDHTEIRLTPKDFLELLPQALGAMDHPSGDGPNTYVVSKVTREAGVTVALSGLGGDELFAGYRIFPRSLRLRNYNWLTSVPQRFRQYVAEIIKSTGNAVTTQKIAELISLENFELSNIYPISRQVYFEGDVSRLLSLNGDFARNHVSEIVDQIEDLRHDENLISRVSISEIQTYMQNVLLRDTDQMSMASALEVRVPFLDHELVEYVLKLSDNLKKPVSPKKLLVDSLHPMLPEEIVDRKKMGFTFPWKYWMKNELKDLTVSRLEGLADRSFFNADAVMNLWERFMKEDPGINWARIWILVVLENWLETNGVD